MSRGAYVPSTVYSLHWCRDESLNQSKLSPLPVTLLLSLLSTPLPDPPLPPSELPPRPSKQPTSFQLSHHCRRAAATIRAAIAIWAAAVCSDASDHRERGSLHTQMTPTSGPCSSFPRPVSTGDKPPSDTGCFPLLPQNPLLLSTFTHGPVASVHFYPWTRCFGPHSPMDPLLLSTFITTISAVIRIIPLWPLFPPLRYMESTSARTARSPSHLLPMDSLQCSVPLSSPSLTQLTSASLPCTSFQIYHGQNDYDVHPLAVHLGGLSVEAPLLMPSPEVRGSTQGSFIHPVCLCIC